MKKLATLLTLMAGVGFVIAQPTIHNPSGVSFQNNEAQKSAGVPSHLVTNSDGTLLTGTQYEAELYYMNTTTASLTPIAASLSQFKSTTTTSGKGTWNGPGPTVALPAGYGGIDVTDDGSGLGTFIETGDGSGAGAGYYPVTLAVRVWDSLTGATYETATGAKGSSPNFVYVQRFTANPPATTDTAMLAQRSFTVVPEPSAIALSVIGVAGLLFIRRRK